MKDAEDKFVLIPLPSNSLEQIMNQDSYVMLKSAFHNEMYLKAINLHKIGDSLASSQIIRKGPEYNPFLVSFQNDVDIFKIENAKNDQIRMALYLKDSCKALEKAKSVLDPEVSLFLFSILNLKILFMLALNTRFSYRKLIWLMKHSQPFKPLLIIPTNLI